MLSTLLRSATQATDSTLRGCTANSAATTRLRAVYPVNHCKNKKQQQRIRGVQQNAGVMVTDRIELKQLAIEGVRKPGQRMPVRLIERGECPSYRFPVKTRPNMRILGDIAIVVEVHETIARHGIVESKCGHHQQQPQHNFLLASGAEKSLVFDGRASAGLVAATGMDGCVFKFAGEARWEQRETVLNRWDNET